MAVSGVSMITEPEHERKYSRKKCSARAQLESVGGMLKSQIQLVIRIIILDVLESKEDKPKDAPEPETEEPRAGNPKFKTATKARKLVNNLVNFLWVGWSVGRLVGLS